MEGAVHLGLEPLCPEAKRRGPQVRFQPVPAVPQPSSPSQPKCFKLKQAIRIHIRRALHEYAQLHEGGRAGHA